MTPWDDATIITVTVIKPGPDSQGFRDAITDVVGRYDLDSAVHVRGTTHTRGGGGSPPRRKTVYLASAHLTTIPDEDTIRREIRAHDRSPDLDMIRVELECDL